MKKSGNTNLLEELLCFKIYTLNRSFGRYYTSAFSGTELTYPKFVILMALATDGPLSVSDLSTKAGVEANTLSPLLKKMADIGLISRRRTEHDERRVEVGITPFGEQTLAQAQSVIVEGFRELEIDPSRMKQAMQFLNEVQEKVERVRPPKLNRNGTNSP